jgi:hypothetical protein
MNPIVEMVIAPTVDWQQFVTIANEETGRSPTRELDACGIAVGSIATFLSALGEFKRVGSNPVTVHRDADTILAFLTFAFICSTDKETLNQIYRETQGLVILQSDAGKGRENFLVSGTLRAWKAAILECCRPNMPVEVREFFNRIWEIFDKAGFRDVFANYQRKNFKDKTFVLEARSR